MLQVNSNNVSTLSYSLCGLDDQVYYDLKQAVLENKYQRVKELIELYKPHYTPIDEPILLLLAVQKGNSQIVELLIENHADINSADENNETALMKAIIEAHTDIATLLIDKGAQLDIQNKQGKTALQLACNTNNHEIVILLINGGTLPLSSALDGEYTDIVRFFFNEGGQLRESFLLLLAVEMGKSKIVESLMKNGVDIDIVHKEHGCTSLMIAILKEHTEIAKLLIEKSTQLDIKSIDGYTALHMAYIKDNAEIVKLLIQKKASLDTPLPDSNTLLMISIAQGRNDLTKFLIENGAGIDIKNNDTVSPLLMAIQKQNIEVVKLLIEKGVQLHDSPLLLVAIKSGNSELVELLLNKGVDINSVSEKNATMLMLAILEDRTEIARLLIERGARLDIKDIAGRTALIWAIANDRTEIAKLLIEKSSLMDINKEKKESPLKRAIIRLNIEVVKALIEKGVELDSIDDLGNSSLLYATFYDAKKILKLLCQSGAKITSEVLNDFFADPIHPECAIELLRYTTGDIINYGIIRLAIHAAIKDTVDTEDVTKCCIYEMLVEKAPHVTLHMKNLHTAVQKGLSERAIRALLKKVSLQDRIEFALLYKQDDIELPKLIDKISLEVAENIVDLAIQHKCRNLKFYYDLFTKHEKLMITKAQFSAIGKLIVKQSESEQLFLAKTMKLLNARSPHMSLSELNNDILEDLREQQRRRTNEKNIF